MVHYKIRTKIPYSTYKFVLHNFRKLTVLVSTLNSTLKHTHRAVLIMRFAFLAVKIRLYKTRKQLLKMRIASLYRCISVELHFNYFFEKTNPLSPNFTIITFSKIPSSPAAYHCITAS